MHFPFMSYLDGVDFETHKRAYLMYMYLTLGIITKQVS